MFPNRCSYECDLCGERGFSTAAAARAHRRARHPSAPAAAVAALLDAPRRVVSVAHQCRVCRSAADAVPCELPEILRHAAEAHALTLDEYAKVRPALAQGEKSQEASLPTNTVPPVTRR